MLNLLYLEATTTLVPRRMPQAFMVGLLDHPGTDEGFDVTALVQGWLDGSYANFGVRIAFDGQAYVGASFSDADHPATLDSTETLQLIITTSTPSRKSGQ